MTYAEMIITACVVVLVLFAMWRVGQLNPVGTGRLARRINALEGKVAQQGERLDGFEKSIVTIAGDVGSMGREVAAMRMELAADRGLGERTWSAVDRLQDYFIGEAFKRGDGR